MAGTNGRTAPELKTESYAWGRICSGTREQLTAAGIVKPGEFPGDPGRGKCTSRVGLAYGLPGLFDVTRTSRHHFTARVNYTEVERAARERQRALQDAETRRAAQIREALAKPDGLRKLAENSMGWSAEFLDHAFNLTHSPSEPWTFSPAVQDKARRLGREVLDLFNDSEIRPSTAGVSETDAKFQRFMVKATAGRLDTKG